MTSHYSAEEALLLGALLLSFRSSEASLSSERLHTRNITPAAYCTNALLQTLAARGLIEMNNNPCARNLNRPCSLDKKIIRIRGAKRSDYNRLLNIQLDVIARKGFGPRDKEIFHNWIARLLVAECTAYADLYATRNGIRFDHGDGYPIRLEILLGHRALGQVFMLIWRAVKFLSTTPPEEQPIDFEILVDQIAEYDFWYKKRSIVPDSYSRPHQQNPSLLSIMIMNRLLAMPDDYVDLAPAAIRERVDALFK